MRREWSGWIKARRWDELERLAKKDPDQILCDTVAELARGFEDKADRKALKKILHILHQSGYRPTPLEVEPAAPKPAIPTRREWAVMESADGAGCSYIVYGVQAGERVRWLEALCGIRSGFKDAREVETSVDEADAYAQSRSLDNTPFSVSASIPPAFARQRLSTTCKASDRPHPLIASWRARWEHDAEGVHPGDSLPRAEVSEQELRTLPLIKGPAIHFRLELGRALPALSAVAGESENLSPEDFQSQIDRNLIGAWTPETTLVQSVQLLDAGYLMHLQGEPKSGVYLAAADDLRARGHESPYALAIGRKTTIYLASLLQSSGKGEDAEGLDADDDEEMVPD